MEELTKDRLVIYHGGCVDGFTAAWAAHCVFGDESDYYPAGYYQDPPNVEGKEVFILDFAYPVSVMREMAGKASEILVLDHHKTWKEDFVALRKVCPANLSFVFDLDRSGAGIAWDVLCRTERPWLIDYVEDRDLWAWKYTDSQTVNAYLQVAPRTWADWTRIAESGVESAREIGTYILMAQRHYIDTVKNQVRRVRLGEHEGIPAVNAPYYATSEIVGELASQVGVPFAISWFQRGDGAFHYSLRSRGDFDVSELARQFGGGGHEKSAGFVVDSPVHVG